MRELHRLTSSDATMLFLETPDTPTTSPAHLANLAYLVQ